MAADARQILANLGPDINASTLFSTFATGFRPDDAALSFWNTKIANEGPEAALTSFLNPSDPNAPRMAAMASDPDFLRAVGRAPAELDPRAQQMFDTFATGFTPSADALQFWSQKINDLGYKGAVNEFLRPTDTASPRYQAMQADPEWQTATGAARANMTPQEFQQSVGLVGEQNRMELDTALRDWYNTYTGGRGMATPVDAYVSMLNGRDGTYLTRDYEAAKQKMLDDAVKAGLYNAPPGSYSTGAYQSWLRTQTQNQQAEATRTDRAYADTVRSWFNTVATGFTPDQAAIDFWVNRMKQNAVDTGDGRSTEDKTFAEFVNPTDLNAPRAQAMFSDPDYIAQTGGGQAKNLFDTYATGFAPDQAALDFWNNKIATLGYQGALQEFLNPTDPNAPRNQLMFQDPEFIAATGRTPTPITPVTPVTPTTPVDTTTGATGVDTTTGATGADTITGGGAGAGGDNTTTQVIVYGPDGTPYSSPAAARAAGVTNYTFTPPGGGSTANAQYLDQVRQLFNLYATGFAPDQAALDFWSNKIATLGYQGALNEFLRPSDTNAPRNQAMFTDPDYVSWAKANGVTIPTTGGAGTGGAGAGTTTPARSAMDLFNLYATGYTPDQTSLDFWNNKIATLGYDRAVQEFINPTDLNAPRNRTMFADPDYLSATGGGQAKNLFNLYATGYTPDQAGLEFWNNKIATQGYQAAMQEFLNPTDLNAPRTRAMFGDPDYISATGGGQAKKLFDLYATGFGTDQTALDFWNNKIATMGYQAALDEFLRPSDVNAPRNKTMFSDPEYIAWAKANGYTIPGTGTTPAPTPTTPGTTPITNANLTNVLPGGAIEQQIASGALPQRVIIGGAPITLGGGTGAYPYGTQARADQLGMPMQRLQEIVSRAEMPPGLVAPPVMPGGPGAGVPGGITTPVTPFTMPANYNPYANVNYGNPFFVNADTVNPYGAVAGNTAGVPVTNPAVTPPAGAATAASTTPGAAGTDTVAPGGVAGTTLLNPLGTTPG